MIGEVYVGDCRTGLRKMKEAGVVAQTCVTSPPYWALRDYGTAKWEGGDASCDHMRPGTFNVGFNERWNNSPGEKKQETSGRRPWPGKQCGTCGAVRIDDQIGLEETPEKFVETMVDVFRCVRDVLADDGTLWLNLGDSYAGSGKGGGAPDSKQQTNEGSLTGLDTRSHIPSGLKPKDMVGIPWRVAFALQADGWWLRSCIIWHKPNAMPEAVIDRPTNAYEFLFLMSKSHRYLYNAAAIREPVTGNAHPRGDGINRKSVPVEEQADVGRVRANDSWHAATADYHEAEDGMRNARNVWSIPTEKYAEAHFATFPRELAKRCILAGSRPHDVVLDPFLGSGTVAHVAQDLGRRWAGTELSEKFAALITKRTRGEGGQLGLGL